MRKSTNADGFLAANELFAKYHEGARVYAARRRATQRNTSTVDGQKGDYYGSVEERTSPKLVYENEPSPELLACGDDVDLLLCELSSMIESCGNGTVAAEDVPSVCLLESACDKIEQEIEELRCSRQRYTVESAPKQESVSFRGEATSSRLSYDGMYLDQTEVAQTSESTDYLDC